MADRIRDLLISIGVDADQADAAMASLDRAVESTKANFSGLVTLAAGATAALAAVGGAALYQASATATSAQAIERQSRSLGIGIEQYQELAHVTGRYGVEVDDLADLFGQLAGQQAAAIDGSDSIAQAFETLGISTDALAAADPYALFAQVSEGMSRTEDASTRLSIAGVLLGEDLAKKLLPMMQAGAEGFAAMAAEARASGKVMSTEAVQSSAKLAASMGSLQTRADGLRTQIGVALIPSIDALVRRMVGWYDANREAIDQNVVEYAERVGRAFTLAADAIAAADARIGGADGWASLAETLGALAVVATGAYAAVRTIGLVTSLASAFSALSVAAGPAVTAISTTIGVLTAAAGAGLSPFLAGVGGALSAILGPVGVWVLGITAAVGAVVAAFASVALAVQDVYTYVQGGDSIMGRLIDTLERGSPVAQQLAEVLRAFGDLAAAAFLSASIYAQTFSATLQTRLEPAIRVVTMLGETVYALVSALGSLAEMAALPALSGLAGALRGAAGALGSAQGQALVAGAATQAGQSAGVLPGGVDAIGALGSGAAQAGAAALASAARSTVSTTTVSVAPSSITIQGAGMTEEQMREALRRHEAERLRLARAAFAGREV